MVSFAVTVDKVKVIAAAQGVQRIHFVVLHHIGVVGQLGAHIDRAVALQRFVEAVLVRPDPQGHWDIPDLDRWVFLDNLVYFLEGSESCNPRACKKIDQDHCFRKPHQQSILLIPKCLNFLHSNFVRLLLHP